MTECISIHILSIHIPSGFLPRDTLLTIFSFLHTRDIVCCVAVSKYWHGVAESHLGWIEVFLAPFSDTKTHKQKQLLENQYHIPKLHALFRKIGALDAVSVNPTAHRHTVGFELNYKQENKEESISLEPVFFTSYDHRSPLPKNVLNIYEYTKFYQCAFPYPLIAVLLSAATKAPRLWRYEVFKVPDTEMNYYISFELNTKELERLVTTNTLEQAEAKIFPTCTVHTRSYHKDEDREDSKITKVLFYKMLEMQDDKDALAHSFFHSKAFIPAKTITPQKQPQGFIKSVQLYKYQLDCVSWMKSIEDDIKVGFYYTNLHKLYAAKKLSIMFDLGNKKMVTADSFQNHTLKAFPKGGILADEMGLGKTVELIALILANPGNPKRLVGNKRSLVNHRFNTNATLVICPNHLIKQWHQEIEKCTGSGMNVVVFSNNRDRKTYADIINADVVLATFQIMKNPIYFRIGMEGAYPPKIGEEYARKNWVDAQLEKIKSVEETSPVLEHFCWRRIIVDEAHEAMNDPFYPNTLSMFSTKFAWYVSGTPFPNVDTSNGLVDFLRFPTVPEDYHRTWVFGDVIMKNLFWRNTKVSVKDEYQIPPVVEDLVLLDLTDIEKAVYKNAGNKDELQRSVCCHPSIRPKYYTLLKGYNSLSKIRSYLISHKKLRIPALNSDIEKAERVLEVSKYAVAHNKSTDPEKIKQLKAKVDMSQQLLDKKKAKYERAKEMLAALEATSERTYDGPDVSSESRLPLLPKMEETPNETQTEEKASGKKEDTVGEKKGNKDVTMEDKKENGKGEADEKQGEGEGEEGEKGKEEGKGEEKEEGKEEEEEKEDLMNSEILSMGVVQLRAELVAREIDIPGKALKADMLKLLQDAVKNKVKRKAPVKIATTKGKKKGKGKRKKPEQDENDEVETKKAKIDQPIKAKKTLQDKIKEQNILQFLTEEHGSKIATIIVYLKRLWAENPDAKVLMFSQFNAFLARMSDLLTFYGIENARMEGNTLKKTKTIEAFRSEDAPIRVLLLSFSGDAAGTNLIQATHIVFLEPAKGSKMEALTTESQAIGRAHRQGQTGQVTIVRFVTRDTVEYTSYVQNNAPEQPPREDQEDGEQIVVLDRGTSFSGRPGLQRAGSSVVLPTSNE